MKNYLRVAAACLLFATASVLMQGVASASASIDSDTALRRDVEGGYMATDVVDSDIFDSFERSDDNVLHSSKSAEVIYVVMMVPSKADTVSVKVMATLIAMITFAMASHLVNHYLTPLEQRHEKLLKQMFEDFADVETALNKELLTDSLHEVQFKQAAVKATVEDKLEVLLANAENNSEADVYEALVEIIADLVNAEVDLEKL